jgi:hypothetical protein
MHMLRALLHMNAPACCPYCLVALVLGPEGWLCLLLLHCHQH